MKRISLVLALCGLFAFSAFASQKCATVTPSATPGSVAVGETIQLNATFTNCGNSALTNVNVKLLVRNGCLGATETCIGCQQIASASYLRLEPGESYILSAPYTPPCAGEWIVDGYISASGRPSLAEGTASFTVTP